jgi:alkylhydroperoxidase family enzyme
MLRSLIDRALSAAERSLRVPGAMDYLRRVARSSRSALLKFGLFMPMANHRRVLPPAPYYVARIVASRHADCGTCVQIEVNQARDHGVGSDVLRAALDDAPETLPSGVAEVYHFARAVVEQDPNRDQLREQVRTRYGEDGLIELALAIPSAQVFPTTKRVLGHDTSCRRVEVRIGEGRSESNAHA